MAFPTQVLPVTFDFEGHAYSYAIRRSKRARHILLHVDDEGGIELVVPRGVSVVLAQRFLLTQREWVVKTLRKKSLAKPAVSRQLVSGISLPLFGKAYILRVVCDSFRTRTSFGTEGREVAVYVCSPGDVRSVLVRWYITQARHYFAEQTAVLADSLGVVVGSLAVSRARSQWGSCIKATGRISLNWRLALGPPSVADYVIAHEVAHLVHSNHSKRFWRTVEKLRPGYQEQRTWLKRHGALLVL